MRFHWLLGLAVGLLPSVSLAADPPVPLKVLLITGGCCHDYAKQKDILKKGLESRAHVLVDQVHTDDKSTKPPLPILGNADYAKGYDVVVHDECGADIKDPKIIAAVLAPHLKGVPGVNLHCAMHSYRIGNPGTRTVAGDERSAWFDYLGLQSSSHGPQEPIQLGFSERGHLIIAGLTNWVTGREELYNNIQVFPTATPLVRGRQIVKARDGSTREAEAVVAWVNQFGKARVFSTTLGHNNATVSDPRYLTLVTRGLLWACDKLDNTYLKQVD